MALHKYPDKKILFGLLVAGLVSSYIGRQLEFTGPILAEALGVQMASVVGTQTNESQIPKDVDLSKIEFVGHPNISLGFVGDIMLDRSVKTSVNKNFSGDYSKLFEKADFLKTPDIMFANLEGPISDKGYDRQNLYSFRMDPKIIPILKEAGIDVIKVANNHENDWGIKAYADTINRLREAGFAICGGGLNRSEAIQPAIIEKEGYKVGFLCFSDVGPDELTATDTSAGMLLASDKEYEQIIKNASEKVNALIVSFHWGVEYKNMHNSRQEDLARRAIENGAILVEGEHPHVVQDVGEINGVPVLYSLGNFIFDQAFSKETMQGLFVTANLADKKVTDIVKHKVVLDSNFAPSLGE